MKYELFYPIPNNIIYKQNIISEGKNNININYSFSDTKIISYNFKEKNKIDNDFSNELQKQNINNIYHSIKFKGRNKQKEEIKNHDYTGDKNLNKNNYQVLLLKNENLKNNNLSFLNNSPKNFNSKKIKLFSENQNNQYNISPIKKNLFSNNKPFNNERKKIRNSLSENKNRIRNNKKTFNDFNKAVNLDDNNNIPIIPKNDTCIENFENSIIKKNNINLIPIPKKIKVLNNEIRKNLFNENRNPNLFNKLNNYHSPQRKNFLNIDINKDYTDEITTNKNKNNKKIFINNLPKQNFLHESNQKFFPQDTLTNEIIILSDNKNVIQKNEFVKPLNIQIKKIKNINNDDFKISWSGKSQAGKENNGNIKINQDAFRVCENINNIKNFNIYILCDGHGKDGHHVSKYITENIISIISSHSSIFFLKSPEQIYQTIIKQNYRLIKDIFSQMDICLSLQKNFDTNKSGCTCVLIMQLGVKIICANIGDSRAILIYSNSSNLFNTKIFPLSLDSKPDLPSEKERIINSGGEVHKKINNKGEYVGPMRVYAKGKDFPGLAMSRSFGDFQCKKYGVINEPSFVEYCLDENCKYLVICSDGVWDFLDNENVVKIGNKHYLKNEPQGFCREILEKASYWWEKEDCVIDDITALVVHFKFFG